MKICYIFPEYNESTSDHFYHHYEFLLELSKRVDVFLIVEKGAVKKVNFGNFKRAYIQKFKFVPLRFLESFLVVLWARILGYKNFYTHYCYVGGINAGIISRLTGGKSYYWHCEMIWEFKQKLFSEIGLNLSLKLSHFLITGSEGLKKEYAKHYGLKLDNIKVMPNWINLERFKAQSEKRNPPAGEAGAQKTILFVHWLAERKGAHLLAPIIKLIDAKFIVIGEGPLKEKILQEIKENKLERRVQILGKIPNKELMKYYESADVFILPSLQEGFPRVLIEAMAMGIPYVAFDVGAVKEISPKIAQDFIVERGNINKFAEKINLLLANQAIYNQFREEELKKVQDYSLEKATDNFINLFL